MEGISRKMSTSVVQMNPRTKIQFKGEVALEEKMIAQMWIHERKYKPVIPVNNSHEAASSGAETKEFEFGYEK